MAFRDNNLDIISIKIVYVGATGVGKTSNVMFLAQKFGPGETDGQLSDSGPSRFFDFVRLDLGLVRETKLLADVLAIPQENFVDQNGKSLFRGADGAIYVVNCSTFDAGAVTQDLENLKRKFADADTQFPQGGALTIQLTHCGSPTVPVETIKEQFKSLHAENIIEANPQSGFGVLETFKATTRGVLESLRVASLNKKMK